MKIDGFFQIKMSAIKSTVSHNASEGGEFDIRMFEMPVKRPDLTVK